MVVCQMRRPKVVLSLCLGAISGVVVQLAIVLSGLHHASQYATVFDECFAVIDNRVIQVTVKRQWSNLQLSWLDAGWSDGGMFTPLENEYRDMLRMVDYVNAPPAPVEGQLAMAGWPWQGVGVSRIGSQRSFVISMKDLLKSISVVTLVTCALFWLIIGVVSNRCRASRRHRKCCEVCGYSLVGLTVIRCPECGAPHMRIRKSV